MMGERKRIPIVACPMDRASVELRHCRRCTYHTRTVGCLQLRQSVPEDYCTRYCPHQAGQRGKPDGSEAQDRDGNRLPPLVTMPLCGAPVVLERQKKEGADTPQPLPIFESIVGGLQAFEDPARNVHDACHYPKELQVSSMMIEV